MCRGLHAFVTTATAVFLLFVFCFVFLLSVPLCPCLKALLTWSYVILRNFPCLQLLTCPPDATNPGQPTPTSEIFPDLLTFPNHSSQLTHLPLMISSVLGVNIPKSPALTFGQFFILSICILVSAICTCARFSACYLPCPLWICLFLLTAFSCLTVSLFIWFSKVPLFFRLVLLHRALNPIDWYTHSWQQYVDQKHDRAMRLESKSKSVGM